MSQSPNMQSPPPSTGDATEALASGDTSASYGYPQRGAGTDNIPKVVHTHKAGKQLRQKVDPREVGAEQSGKRQSGASSISKRSTTSTPQQKRSSKTPPPQQRSPNTPPSKRSSNP